ncbi:uncharacterized protein PHACADRAFT_105136, partial [Phanerochaete carnosa HHB-10118-sp]
GDTVRWSPDGQLYFIGRMNAGRAKIRGQRLELPAIHRADLASAVAAAPIHPQSLIPPRHGAARNPSIVHDPPPCMLNSNPFSHAQRQSGSLPASSLCCH